MLVALVLAAAAHPNSISRSLIVVDGDQARVELRFQTLTLLEELALDADGDLLLGPQELAAERERIGAYLLAGLRLRVGGRLLAGEVTAAQTLFEGGGFVPQQWMVVTLRFDGGGQVLRDLSVEFGLFEVMNAGHLDYATLEWNGEAPAYFVFGLGTREWKFETAAERRLGVVWAFLARGVRAATRAWEPLVLLALLVAAARRGRGVVGVLAVFLAAHAAALGLGCLEVWVPPRSFVELASALALAYVGCDVLLRTAPRALWLEAGVFGGVQGFASGFAFAPSVAGEPLRHAETLVVEWGMGTVLLVVGGVLLALGLTRRDGDWFVGRRVRLGIALLAAGVGFCRFGARAGFLEWLPGIGG